MFRSFFFAGFEGATGYNERGEWIDQIAATQHDRHVDADYRRLRDVSIFAAREAIRWPLVDRKGVYDFSGVLPFVEAARKYRVEVIWDLFHYGFPGDLDIFSDAFVERFAAYCRATAEFISQRHDGPYYFTPVNEPSYFAWAAGEVGLFAPHCKGRGAELKVALIRTAIAGINAIRSVLPDARMVNVDPLCHVVPPQGRLDLLSEAHAFNNTAVFEGWDMLCGRLRPELGGSREHLDIVGVNYYWTNQWELGSGEVPLEHDDLRRVDLGRLVRRVWKRYDRELLITETAHIQDARQFWMNYVADECEILLDQGVPLRGVCLYPILGMPHWHLREQWVRMGLWDIIHEHPSLRRELFGPMRDALRHAQRLEFRHSASSLQNGSAA
jgi:hypothetical protein